MRLNCPNCGAQYEVPVDVIPAEGRDVQCASCGKTWFQTHPDTQVPHAPALDLPETSPTSGGPVSDETPADASSETSAEPSTNAQTLAETIRAQTAAKTEPAAPKEAEDDGQDSQMGDFEAALDAALAEPETADWTFTEEAAEDVPDDTTDAQTLAWDAAPTEAPVPTEEPAPVAAPEPGEAPQTSEPSDETEPNTPFAEENSDPETQGRGRARRRSVDPAVADVLRQEAALEAEARLAEETAIETQPDLGLLPSDEDEASKRAEQARARMARLRGQRAMDAEDFADSPTEATDTRRNLLPDIEEINSTLRATEDRTTEEQPDGRPPLNQRRRGGNRLGFGIGLLLIAGLMFTYSNPETVTQAIPASENAVAGFISLIDSLRIWLDVQMTKLMLWLDSMSSSGTAS